MAIIIYGESCCSICRKQLHEGDEIHGIAPISDTSNPLYEYFDSAVHRSCYDAWESKEEVIAAIEQEKCNFRESEYFKKMMRRFGTPDWIQ